MRAKKIFEDEEFMFLKSSDEKKEKFEQYENFKKYIVFNNYERVLYYIKNNLIDLNNFKLRIYPSSHPLGTVHTIYFIENGEVVINAKMYYLLSRYIK